MRLSAGTLQRGKKTNTYYHSKTYEEDILVHYSCVFKLLHPNADAVMHDEFRKHIEEDIKVEIGDDLYQEAMAKAAEDLQHLCADCRGRKNHPDRPPCDEIECPHCGATSAPICGNCGEIRDNYDTEEQEPELIPQQPTLPQPSRQPLSPYYNR